MINGGTVAATEHGVCALSGRPWCGGGNDGRAVALDVLEEYGGLVRECGKVVGKIGVASSEADKGVPTCGKEAMGGGGDELTEGVGCGGWQGWQGSSVSGAFGDRWPGRRVQMDRSLAVASGGGHRWDGIRARNNVGGEEELEFSGVRRSVRGR